MLFASICFVLAFSNENRLMTASPCGLLASVYLVHTSSTLALFTIAGYVSVSAQSSAGESTAWAITQDCGSYVVTNKHIRSPDGSLY